MKRTIFTLLAFAALLQASEEPPKNPISDKIVLAYKDAVIAIQGAMLHKIEDDKIVAKAREDAQAAIVGASAVCAKLDKVLDEALLQQKMQFECVEKKK